MRLFLRLCLAFVLLVVPVSADAGLGSLLRLGAKLGSSAGKGATAAGKGAASAGKVAAGASKMGLAAKGVTAATALHAADAAFVGLADDGARVALYVARTPDDLVVVIPRGGEAITLDEVAAQAMIRDYGEMAGAAADAGVDVVVHPSALGIVDEAPGVRVLLDMGDGATLPLPRLATRVEGGVRTQSGSLVRTSVDVADLLVDLLQMPIGDGGQVASPSCGSPRPDGTGWVFELAPADAELREEDLAWVRDHGVDLVILGHADVCDPRTRGLAEAIAFDARTWEELWTLAGVSGLEARAESDVLVVSGVGPDGAPMWTLHYVGPPKVLGWSLADHIWRTLVVGVLVLVLAFGIVGATRFRRTQPAA